MLKKMILTSAAFVALGLSGATDFPPSAQAQTSTPGTTTPVPGTGAQGTPGQIPGALGGSTGTAGIPAPQASMPDAGAPAATGMPGTTTGSQGTSGAPTGTSTSGTAGTTGTTPTTPQPGRPPIRSGATDPVNAPLPPNNPTPRP